MFLYPCRHFCVICWVIQFVTIMWSLLHYQTTKRLENSVEMYVWIRKILIATFKIGCFTKFLFWEHISCIVQLHLNTMQISCCFQIVNAIDTYSPFTASNILKCNSWQEDWPANWVDAAIRLAGIDDCQWIVCHISIRFAFGTYVANRWRYCLSGIHPSQHFLIAARSFGSFEDMAKVPG